MQKTPSLSDAFLAAAEAVAAVMGGRNLDAALAPVPGAVRPATQDLAYGALRRYGHGDFLLERLLARPLKDKPIRSLLLAALYRLAERPEDAHTTVDQAVRTAGRLSGGRFRALVNAVLRGYLRRQEELESLAEQDAVAKHRHPAWWLAALQQAYPHTWPDIVAADNSRPPMTLRVNVRKCSLADYRARLAEVGIGARALEEAGPNSPADNAANSTSDSAALCLARPVPVDRLPGFADGWVSVQDAGAQRAATLLDPRPGHRVLDACAAPGGKTAHLLERNDLDLWAVEVDAGRAARIDDNLARLGLAARVVVGDARTPETWWDGRPFDRILADVPCSASGVVRRHPDAKWLRRATDVAGFATTQAEILDRLWQLLAPGGKMLYCTCSVFPEENSRQVAAFVARHPDARRLPTGGPELELQLTPSPDHDGFYYALLEKPA